MLKNTKVDGVYASVSADGTIRIKVEEGTPGAKKREGDLQDGSHFIKYELEYTELTGKITGINFYEGDYGKNIQVTVTDGEEEPVILCLGVSSNFGEDFMKKLPNVNLDKEVTIKPYSMISKKNGKTIRGVSISQEDNKLLSFFSEKQGDKFVITNGMPEPSTNMDKMAWKMYFMQVDLFLVKYIEDNIMPKLVNFTEEEIKEAGEEEIKAEDIQM